MVRRHIEVRPLEAHGCAMFTISPARAAGCIVHHWAKGGLLVFSVYLETGGGLGHNNWQVLDRVAQVVAYYGLPYIIAGDFNMAAEDLIAGGWVRRHRFKARRFLT